MPPSWPLLVLNINIFSLQALAGIWICGGKFQNKIKGLVFAMQSISSLSASD
jgi:hypothetical protein